MFLPGGFGMVASGGAVALPAARRARTNSQGQRKIMSTIASAPITRDQISIEIAKKAWHDEAFHKAILSDANAVYEKELGRKLPAGIKIKVLEDDAHTVHFVIPQKPANAAELSDQDLEAVAGGSKASLIVEVSMAVSQIAVGAVQEFAPPPSKW
jgi:hypothetical protein